MSRNLCTSSCCDNIVRIENLVGKPIEFRRYNKFAPEIGTRWDCPTCGIAYFVAWKRRHEFWAKPENALENEITFPDGRKYPNREKGRFVRQYEWQGKISTGQTGYFTLDLSYYESYNDEPGYDQDQRQEILSGKREPSYWCTGAAEDAQWVL